MGERGPKAIDPKMPQIRGVRKGLSARNAGTEETPLRADLKRGYYSVAAIAERRWKRAKRQMVSALVDSRVRCKAVARLRSLDMIGSLIPIMNPLQLLRVGKRLQRAVSVLEQDRKLKTKRKRE